MYENIRNMSDEEFQTLKANAFSLGILNQVIEMEKIRKMPADWITEENYRNASIIGDAVAVIETAQSAVAKGLMGVSGKAAPLIRFGTDEAFSLAEMGTLVSLNSEVFGTTKGNEFENAGGKEALIIDCIGNGIGMLADYAAASSMKNIDFDTSADKELRKTLIETARNRDNLEFLSNYRMSADSNLDVYNALKTHLLKGKLDSSNPALQTMFGIDPRNPLSDASLNWLKEDINNGKVNLNNLRGIELEDIFEDYFDASKKMETYYADGTMKYLKGVVGKSEMPHLQDELKQDVLNRNTGALDARWRTVINSQGIDSTTVILDSKARAQKAAVKQTIIGFFNEHPEYGVTTTDINDTFNHYHYYESVDLMREDYAKKTQNTTKGIGVHYKGEIYISNVLDNVDIAHEAEHSLRYRIVQSNNGIDNGMYVNYNGQVVKLKGINEVITEMNAQKKYNVDKGHSGYEISKPYVTRLNNILTEAGYDDPASASYYLVNDKKYLSDAITDIYGNTDFLVDFDRHVQDVHGYTPSAVKEASKAQLNAMLDSLEREVLR